MKKFILCSLCSCMLFLSLPMFIKASSEDEQKENQEMCTLISSEVKNTIYLNKVYDESGSLVSFDAIVPLAEGTIPVLENRSVVGANLTILGGIKKSCTAAFYLTGGFNPCAYLAGALGRKIINGIVQWESWDTGKWDVSRTSHYGQIPGCLPMHSASCHGWYYTYSYLCKS